MVNTSNFAKEYTEIINLVKSNLVIGKLIQPGILGISNYDLKYLNLVSMDLDGSDIVTFEFNINSTDETKTRLLCLPLSCLSSQDELNKYISERIKTYEEEEKKKKKEQEEREAKIREQQDRYEFDTYQRLKKKFEG